MCFQPLHLQNIHVFFVEGKPSWFTFLAENGDSLICGHIWEDVSMPVCFPHQQMLATDWNSNFEMCLLQELCIGYLLLWVSLIWLFLVEFQNVKGRESFTFMTFAVRLGLSHLFVWPYFHSWKGPEIFPAVSCLLYHFYLIVKQSAAEIFLVKWFWLLNCCYSTTNLTMCFHDKIINIVLLFLRLFKGVIDNIQQLNVTFCPPAYIAFTLHHCCCSNHLPP